MPTVTSGGQTDRRCLPSYSRRLAVRPPGRPCAACSLISASSRRRRPCSWQGECRAELVVANRPMSLVGRRGRGKIDHLRGLVDLLELLAQHAGRPLGLQVAVLICLPMRLRGPAEVDVSRIWPTFMREGTPSGLSTMSTGVPSSRYGMSSSGKDARDHALVAVAAGHLVAHLTGLPLDGHVDLHQLDHARGQARRPW